MNLVEETAEVALVFWAGFMLGLFKARVANEDLALFAPDARLQADQQGTRQISGMHLPRISNIQT